MKRVRHILSITDLTRADMVEILSVSARLKKRQKSGKSTRAYLRGKTMIMIFEKPSLRTHASFDIGMYQLGAHALYLGPEQIGLGKREPISHAANVLSRMGDVIMARVFDHETLVELAAHSLVPVINGLSDLEHPCQILADLLTISEHKGRLTGKTLAFVGDGENNVTHSLLLAGAMLGMHVRVACPKKYTPKKEIVAKTTELAATYKGSVVVTTDPKKAVDGADVVYTDTWVSMGDEKQKKARLRVFKPYQVHATLMNHAAKDAIFMHDMPAYIGNEVTKDVFDGAQSVAYDQAENRLHAQKGLLVWLLRAKRRSVKRM